MMDESTGFSFIEPEHNISIFGDRVFPTSFEGRSLRFIVNAPVFTEIAFMLCSLLLPDHLLLFSVTCSLSVPSLHFSVLLTKLSCQVSEPLQFKLVWIKSSLAQIVRVQAFPRIHVLWSPLPCIRSSQWRQNESRIFLSPVTIFLINCWKLVKPQFDQKYFEHSMLLSHALASQVSVR